MRLHHDRPLRRAGPKVIGMEAFLHEQQRAAHGRTESDSALKLLFDWLAAVMALLILAPLFLLVAGLIYARDPGPIFFAHKRLGKDGRFFNCLKFRTMAVDGDERLEQHLAANPAARREWEATRKLKDDPRVTGLGHVLRKSSIDELPQLLNVLRGEMSLVGPRPIVDDEVHFYGHGIRDYLRVRPGLTGPWQISGRNDVGYEERVRMDRIYARTRSFGGDIQIIMKTIPAVLTQKGSY